MTKKKEDIEEGIVKMDNKILNFIDNTNNVTLTLTRDDLFEIGLSIEIEIDNFNQRIATLNRVLAKIINIQKEKVDDK